MLSNEAGYSPIRAFLASGAALMAMVPCQALAQQVDETARIVADQQNSIQTMETGFEAMVRAQAQGRCADFRRIDSIFFSYIDNLTGELFSLQYVQGLRRRVAEVRSKGCIDREQPEPAADAQWSDSGEPESRLETVKVEFRQALADCNAVAFNSARESYIFELAGEIAQAGERGDIMLREQLLKEQARIGAISPRACVVAEPPNLALKPVPTPTPAPTPTLASAPAARSPAVARAPAPAPPPSSPATAVRVPGAQSSESPYYRYTVDWYGSPRTSANIASHLSSPVDVGIVCEPAPEKVRNFPHTADRGNLYKYVHGGPRYGYDSDLCASAVHRGLIGWDGGEFRIRRSSGLNENRITGSLSNGILSADVPNGELTYIILEYQFGERQAAATAVSAGIGNRLDAIVADDSRGWQTNKYVPGSMSNVLLVDGDLQSGTFALRGDYTYNQSAQGWVIARFKGGQLDCLQYHDIGGTCRRPN